MKRDTPESSARVYRFVKKRGLQPVLVDGKLHAYANHGRWVADCPCGGAELVREDQPMLCGSCGEIRAVVWPVNADDVEALLERRPDRRNQNWRPNEPVAGLAVENERHL